LKEKSGWVIKDINQIMHHTKRMGNKIDARILL
jgi:hypothetical protein